MGSPKAGLEIDGQRLIDRAVTALRDGGCEPVYAVVRAGTNAAAVVVINLDPDRGMRSSLELAVEAAATGSLLITLVDMPGIDAGAVRAVREAWRPGRIVQASYAGRRAQPTVMSIEHWREALTVAGPDEGARRFLAAHPGLVDLVEIDGDPSDLDTPEDLSRWGAAPRDGGGPAPGSTSDSG
jgi:molybdenum cofactor cytidylyltransferase/nicotine blue oxidoreductase